MQLMKLKLGVVTYLGYDFRISGNEIEYKSESGATRILYINGCSFSFEQYETRDWTVVIGTGTGNFWAQHKGTLIEGEVVVQDNLTEDEAKELSTELIETRNRYKF